MARQQLCGMAWVASGSLKDAAPRHQHVAEEDHLDVSYRAATGRAYPSVLRTARRCCVSCLDGTGADGK